MAPNPSTVPIRVSAVMIGSGAPWRMRNFDCSTLGKFSGQVSRGTSRIGVENCSTRCSSQASMAGTRYFVRGRDVVALFVESAMAADALGDQRFDDFVIGKQLRLAELGLQGSHRCSPWDELACGPGPPSVRGRGRQRLAPPVN